MHNAPYYDVDLKLVFHSIRLESLHTVYRCCSYDLNRDDLFHTEHTHRHSSNGPRLSFADRLDTYIRPH